MWQLTGKRGQLRGVTTKVGGACSLITLLPCPIERGGGQNRATGAGGNHLLIAEKTPQEGFAFQGLESYYFFNYKENKPHLAVRSPVERKRLTEMEKIDRSGRGGGALSPQNGPCQMLQGMGHLHLDDECFIVVKRYVMRV